MENQNFSPLNFLSAVSKLVFSIPLSRFILKPLAIIDGFFSIRLKIFAFFILIGAVVSYLSYYAVSVADIAFENLQATYDKPLMSSNYAREALSSFQKARIEALTNNDADAVKDYIEDANDLLETVKERAISRNAEKIIQKISSELNSWLVEYEKDNHSPRLSQETDEVLDYIDLLVENEFAAGYDFVLSGKTSVYNGKELIEKIALGILVFLSVGMFYIYCAISFPIKKCLKLARNIACGNLSNKIEPSGSYEFQRLLSSFQVMQTDLVKIIETRQQIILDEEKQKQIAAVELLMNEESLKREELIRQQNQKDVDRRKRILVYLSHSLNKNINHIINNISHTDNNLSRIAKDVNQSAQDTTETMIEKSIQADKDIEAIIRSFHHGMNEIKDTIEDVSDEISKVSKSVSQVKHVSEAVSNEASTLVHATNDIKKITSVIKEITNNINMLSINATIEAARAKEHGKGFTVVAQEIKGLAIKTANESDNIVNQIEKLTNVSVQTQKLLPQINDAISEMNFLFNRLEEKISIQNREVNSVSTNTNEKIVTISNELKELFIKIQENNDQLFSKIRKIDDVSKSLTDNSAALDESIKGFTKRLAS